MRVLFSILVVWSTLIGLPSQAQPTKASGLYGVWAVDVSRLPQPPQARPKSVSISFSQARNGGLTTRVDVSDAAAAQTYAESTTTLDGTPSPVQGNLEANVAATTMPVPGVLVMQLARGGTPASTRIYAVSDDGKSMVETVAYFGSDGTPILRTHYFARVAPR
ncbi:MAG: hypothetical protein ABL985_13365 [Casimicrobium sp.]